MQTRLPVDLDLFQKPGLRLGLAPYVPDVDGVLNDYVFLEYENRLLSLPEKGVGRISKSYDPAFMSYKLYGTTDLWGPLLLYNSMGIFDWIAERKFRYFAQRDYEVMISELLLETQKKLREKR